MNGPDSILDPVARRLRCTESSPSAHGSAQLTRLNSTRRGAAGEVAGGTHYDDVPDDCTMTWLAD
jgi:hypothetical protein